MSGLLTPEEAGDRLGVSDETMRRWAKADRIAYVLLPSGRFMFRSEDIEAILTPRPAAS